jgi:hypothetical protein
VPLADSLPALHVANVGATYYVDAAAGNDTTGTGSSGSPWATLQRAYTYLRDTATWPTDQDIRIVVRAGTYQRSAQQYTLDTWYNGTGRQPTATQWVIWDFEDGAVVKLPSGTSPTTAKGAMRLDTVSSGTSRYQMFVNLHIDGDATRTNNTGDAIGVYLSGSTSHVHFVRPRITGIYAADTDDGSPTSKAQGIFGGRDATDIIVWQPHIDDIGTFTGTIATQEHGVYLSGDRCSVVGPLIYDIPNGYGVQLYDAGATIDGSLVCSGTIANCGQSCILVPGHGTNLTIKNMILVEGKGDAGTSNGYGVEFDPTGGGTGSGNVIDHVVHYLHADGNVETAPSGWTITNAQTADPLFVDYAGRDFRLTAESPAIDYTDAEYSTTVDLVDTARVNDPDAGAYEYHAYATWRSWDIEISSSSAVATVDNVQTGTTADVRLYESTDDDGVTEGSLLADYRTTALDPTGANWDGAAGIWYRASGPDWDKPAVGKSALARGSDPDETSVPSPTGVYDLQMQTPSSAKLTVAAFVVPVDGDYRVSGLAARRAVAWATGLATFKVFDETATLIASIATGDAGAGDPEWQVDSGTYDLLGLVAGDRIHFALDYDGAPDNDATEVAWIVELLTSPATGTSAPAGAAAATGTAHAPSARVAPTASVATTTVVAYQPNTAIDAAAQHASSTATAHAPTPRSAPAAPTATGTAAAHSPQLATAPRAGHATGTVTAFDATVSTATATNAAAQHAAATVTAHQPGVAVAPAAAHASGTAAAHAGSSSVAATAGHASGTVTAFSATVSTATVTNAAAQHAAGTASAYAPSVRISVSAVLATATVVAYDPGGSIAPVATAATATVTGYAPSVSSRPTAGHATATAAAHTSTARVAATAGHATGAVAGYDPTVAGPAVELVVHAAGTATAVFATATAAAVHDADGVAAVFHTRSARRVTE